MGAIAFDTLAYAKELKESGFTEQQAEVLAQSQARLIDEKLVTREHFDIRMKELEASLKRDMKELEARMTIRLGSYDGDCDRGCCGTG